MSTKRKDYINWDKYFMGVAYLSAQRSKDPNTQVGACIVNNDNHIISVGYNGTPTGIDDDNMPWNRTGEFLNTKYPYVCHAELNAILNNIADLKNCTIYVTMFPCNECAKAIIQSGIKSVVYAENKYPDSDSTVAAMKLFNSCNITLRQFTGQNPLSKKAVLSFTDGFSMNSHVHPDLQSAQKVMKDAYRAYYDKNKDLDDESYIDDYEAKVVRTSEDIFLWQITLV